MPYIGNNHIAGDHVNNFKVLDDISSYTATFDGSATSVIDTTNNTIRIPEHRFIQGQRVTYTNGGGGNIGGLTTGTAYFVSFDSADTIKLATSLVNANNNTVINLSAVGSGTSHTLNAAFDGVNTKFKLTYRSGKPARLNNATQINVAVNNVIQRPNSSATTFTEGFALEDNHKIVFKTAPTVNDIFWGSIIANTIENFDLQENEIDNFTGNGSTTEFTLSTLPANNESVIVTIDGVLQHPSDKDTVRSYTLIDSVLQFTAAPAANAEIQARHIGFAGATTADVSGFYGRTGNVALTTADNISVGNVNVGSGSSIAVGTGVTIESNGQATFTGVVTALQFKGDGSNLTGIDATALKDTSGNVKIQAQASGAVYTGVHTFTTLKSTSADFSGNVSIGGTLTYEDVTNVDSVGLGTFRDGLVVQTGTATTALIVEGDARVTGILTIGTGSLTITDRDINAVGVVTGSNFKTGTSNLHNVGLEVAQLNVLGGDLKIGTGVTILNDGNSIWSGVSTAKNFKTGTTNVHDVGIEVAQLNVLGGNLKIGTGVTICCDTGNSTFSGISTAKNFITGTTNVHNVGVELAGINVLGADTPIGTGSTIFNSGQIVAQAGAEIAGIVTAAAFRGDGSALTGLTAVGTGAIGGLTVRNESGTAVGTAGSISTLDFNGSSGVTVTAASGAAGIATVVISAELVSDSSPQLGGNLDVNSKTISGSGTINLTGSVTATSFIGPLTGNVTGNASGSASRLATARTIGGTAFDGTANIVPAQATNSDTVDNLHAASFVRSDASDTLTGGTYTLNSSTDQKIILSGSTNPYIRFQEGTTDRAYLQFNGGDNKFYIVNQESGDYLILGDGHSGLQWHANGSLATVWTSANGGSGSGLDADTLDGLDSGAFLRSDANDTSNYRITFSNNATENEDTIATSTGSQGGLEVYNSGVGNDAFMAFHSGGDFALYFGLDADTNSLSVGGWSMGAAKYKIWHEGNDGSGSGLDADLWDGNQFSSYLNQAVTTGSNPTFSNVYVNDWFRNNNSGEGLYNQATGQHWYSDSSHYWNLTVNNQGSGGLRFRDGHAGTIRGYVYHNNSNQVGFLDQNGSWTVRTETAGITKLGSNGYQLTNGNNNRNMKFTAGGSGDIGISGYDSGGNWRFQLYGTSGSYGFLDANWNSWDIKKDVNGALQIDPDGGGLHNVLHDGETSSSASGNTIVRRDSSGYIFANYFNASSGDMTSTMPGRFYTSHDNYIRYVDYGTMRSLMNTGGMGRYNGREQSTSDSNYWTGSMGWSNTDFNTIFDYGSGSIDVWSNPSNQPSGTSHWVGSQHLHYTNVSSRYGHQIVVGAGNPDLMYVRGVWGGGFTSWKKMLNEGNYSSVMSSSTTLYIDVYSTGSTSDRNTANSWAQSAVSIPNDCYYIVRYYYAHSYWAGNATHTSHEDRRCAWYKNSSGTTYWAGVDRS